MHRAAALGGAGLKQLGMTAPPMTLSAPGKAGREVIRKNVKSGDYFLTRVFYGTSIAPILRGRNFAGRRATRSSWLRAGLELPNFESAMFCWSTRKLSKNSSFFAVSPC